MTIYFYGLNEEVGILKKLTLLFAFFFGLYLNFSFAHTINISELYQNNSFGVPQLLDQIVTIRGEVTVTDQFGNIGTYEITANLKQASTSMWLSITGFLVIGSYLVLKRRKK